MGPVQDRPRGAVKTIHKFYSKYQHSHEGGGGKTHGETHEGRGRARFEVGQQW